jgi:predicted ester cyclase
MLNMDQKLTSYRRKAMVGLKTKLVSVVALLTLTSCGGQTNVQSGSTGGEQTTMAQASAPATTDAGGKKQCTPEENNAAVVKTYNGAWNGGDLAMIDKGIDPEGLDHSPLSTEKGTEGFKKIIKSFRDAMPGLKMTIEDEIYDEDKVVHRWKVEGKHTGAPLFGVKPAGKDITLKGISILRMDNCMVAERWSSLDQFGLLVQLGVVPPPGGAPAAKQ